ncbi:MAG: deoxyribose-phosphate aldolase [Eubacteriales bacterium]
MKTEELKKIMGGRIMESYFDYANVSNLVYEALDFDLECIQVFPNMIPQVKEVLNGRKLEICAVISYPHGTFTPEQKAFAIRDVISQGATQVEVAINNVNVRSGNWDKVRDEFKACREAAGGNVLKAIVEVEFLKDDMLKKVCELAVEEGIDRLSTSIGVYTKSCEGKDVLIGVTVDDVKKMKPVCGEKVKIVAMGNIDSAEKCKAMLDAGADYISSEYAAKILRSL